MIQVRNLTRRYRRLVALSDVCFDVHPGEVVAVLGGNGAGKSTLLRCLLGVTSFEGSIRVAGLDPLAAGKQVRGRIGYLPQSAGLHLDLTVDQTIRLYAGMRGVPIAAGRELIAEMGLADRLDHAVGELSGGMRQRLGFAVSRLGDPPILLLDEPTASLDRASQEMLIEKLGSLARAGKTVLFSTHSHHELLPVAHRSLVLEEGRLLAPPGTPVGLATDDDEGDESPRCAAGGLA